MKKQIKAWAVFDKESGTLGRYSESGEYMISPQKIARAKLHESYKSIPIIITYSLPPKKGKKKKV